jgi:hypothetical protein
MATIVQTTLLDLVHAINSVSASDTETVATIAYLVNSGKVRLCGSFAGAKIYLAPPVTRGKATTRSHGV